VAMEHDLHTNIGVINVCIEFNIFKVKGTYYFSRHSGFLAT
jgi:hypothetical protein